MYYLNISGLDVKPNDYLLLYDLLLQKGIKLINTPNEYNYCHLFINWYPFFKAVTARSYELFSLKEIDDLSKTRQGSFIVKDYVKSRKHEWYDACYIKDIKDLDNVKRVINNFITRQGDQLVGNPILREFISLKQVGMHDKSSMPLSEEYRAFYYFNKLVLVNNYWDKNNNIVLSDQDMEFINEQGVLVQSNFFTIDFARKDDGKLIVMELGDGQVSGLQEILPIDFYNSIKKER